MRLDRLRIQQTVRLLLLAGIPSGGQPQTPAPPAAVTASNAPEMTTHEAPTTFTTGVNLVLVPVVVRNGQGRAIGTLGQDDFQLTDKGKPQIITKFSIERPGTPSIRAVQATEENAPADKTATPAPPIPERFVAYLFDDIHLQAGDLIQARQAAKRHFAGLETTSRAAVFTTSGRTTLDFTDDPQKLGETLDRIQPFVSAGSTINDCPYMTYYMADLIVNKSDPQALAAVTQDEMACGPQPAGTDQASIQAWQREAQTQAQLAAQRELATGDSETKVATSVLKDVVRRLSAAPGSRTLALVSPGFLMTLDNRIDENDILDKAIRANVTINSLDARGVFNPGLEADASQRSRSSTSFTLLSQYQRDSALSDEDVLGELASATGGTFFHNDNDLFEGFKSVAAQPEYIYVLGFSPQNLKYDGSYHSVKVTVKTQRGLSLQARRGYYAPKHAADPEQEAKEEIREALFSREELRDLPADLNLQFFKSSEYQARLSVVARVDVKQLRFRKAEDRNLDNLTITSGVFDRNGNLVNGIQKVVEMRLRDQTLAALPASGISVRTTFDLAPGSYAVRLVVRDSEGQVMAARNGTVQIP